MTIAHQHCVHEEAVSRLNSGIDLLDITFTLESLSLIRLSESISIQNVLSYNFLLVCIYVNLVFGIKGRT
jgi:hypothetical protein